MDTAVQQIKERLDIVEVVSSYLKLEKTGINLRARCPFHQEKGPSFFVSPSRQTFKCFGCGAGGSVFDFIMKIEGVEFADALKILAVRAGIELPSYNPKEQTERTRILSIMDLAVKFFETQLNQTSLGKKCQDYLFKRGLNRETISKWRLGYSPSSSAGNWRVLSDFLVGQGFLRNEIVKAGLAVNSEKSQTPYDRFRGRIMFPIFDINGQAIGFGARKTDFIEGNKDEGPKYLNIPNTLLYDKSRALYGLNFAKMEIRKKDFCVLTEGYMDVILSHQADFANTVAASGTALTSFQLSIIKRYTNNLRTAFDRDVAGSSATQRGIDIAQKENFDVKVILMPQGQDPADVISKNPSEWEKAISEAKDITSFYFEEAFSKFDCATPEGKKQIAIFFLPQLKKITNNILLSYWIQKLALSLGVSSESIEVELKKIPLALAADSSEKQKLEGTSARPDSEVKNRQSLLEEKILTLILKEPSFIDFIHNDDIDLFSPQFKTVFTCFKESKISDVATLEKAIYDFEENKEIKTVLDTCFFQAENEPIHDPEQEIQVCLEYFRRLAWQAGLKKYGDELKLAEQAKDANKLKEIIYRINSLTKNRPA